MSLVNSGISTQMKSKRRDFLLASLSTGLFLSPGISTAHQTDAANTIRQPPKSSNNSFIKRAMDMRDLAGRNGDQSYGAVVVSRSGKIVGQAPSRVVINTDPTAHAEMEAVRDATRRLGQRDLSGHKLYSSSRPCPMCEAAAYWANIDAMIYGSQANNAGRPKLCG